MLTSWLLIGHGFLVADVSKHGCTYSHFSTIHWQVIPCDCRAVILDRQTIHVHSLLRPFRAFGISSTLFSNDYWAFRIKPASIAGGLLAGVQSQSQVTSYFVNSSTQCRKNSSWDQPVPSDYSQSLNFLMLWAQRRRMSWVQYYPQPLEKVQQGCIVQSKGFFWRPWNQLRSSWCRTKAWPELVLCGANLQSVLNSQFAIGYPCQPIFHPQHLR